MQHKELVPPQRNILVSYASDVLADSSIELEVLKRHQNQIRYCFERELVKDPGLPSMSLLADVAVDADGTVKTASWAEEGLHEAVSGCVQGRLMRMKFPAQEQAWDMPLTITITHERREG